MGPTTSPDNLIPPPLPVAGAVGQHVVDQRGWGMLRRQGTVILLFRSFILVFELCAVLVVVLGLLLSTSAELPMVWDGKCHLARRRDRRVDFKIPSYPIFRWWELSVHSKLVDIGSTPRFTRTSQFLRTGDCRWGDISPSGLACVAAGPSSDRFFWRLWQRRLFTGG